MFSTHIVDLRGLGVESPADQLYDGRDWLPVITMLRDGSFYYHLSLDHCNRCADPTRSSWSSTNKGSRLPDRTHESGLKRLGFLVSFFLGTKSLGFSVECSEPSKVRFHDRL